MPRGVLGAVAAALVWLGAPVAAADKPIAVLDISGMPDQQLSAMIANGEQQLRTGGISFACGIVPFAEELQKRHPANLLETYVAYYDGLCLMSSAKPAEALAKAERAEDIMPLDKGAQLGPGLDLLAFQAAMASNNMEAASKHAVHIAERDNPAEFARQDMRQYRFVMGRAKKEQADAVGFAFARASAFSSLPADMQQLVAYRSAAPLIDMGERDLALKLIGILTEPSSYMRMLIDRQFAPVWPEMEARAGPHMANVLSANVARREAAMKADPGNRRALGDMVQALVYAHRYQEAVDLAGKVDISPQGLTGLQEGDGWALNAMVHALDSLGRRAEADAVFDKLASVPADPGRGWMVNFTINRAERLVGEMRWKEAMPAAELAVATAARHGSPYAKEVAAVDRLCAAHGLDPKRDLHDWWTEIDRNWKDNIGAAVQGAICLGDRTTARRYFIDALNDPEKRREAILLLQVKEADMMRDTAFGLEDPRTIMEADPTLRELFNHYGRDLPAPLLPSPAN